MSFNIRIEDVDSVGLWVELYVFKVGDQLARVAAASQSLAGLESFKGATADNVKAYFGEMHVNAANILIAALNDVLVRYGLYMHGYSEIDSAKDACFNEDTLQRAYTDFSASRTDVSERRDVLSKTLTSIEDILHLATPPVTGLDAGIADLAEMADTLESLVSEHESWHASNALGTGGLVEQASSMISEMGAYASSAGTGYVPGSFFEMPFIEGLISALGDAGSYREGNAWVLEGAYGALNQRIQARYDEEMARLAKERQDQGVLQVIEGALLMIGGAIVIAASGGSATPVGVAMMAFGASNVIEGVQNYHYGSIGDLNSFAINPIRDTVFLGNQGLYDLAVVGVSIAGGLAVPINAAVGAARAAGTSVIGAAARTVGIEMAVDLAVDTGVTLLGDPVIRQLYGDGVEGDVASLVLHGVAGCATLIRGHAAQPGHVTSGADAPSAAAARMNANRIQGENFAREQFEIFSSNTSFTRSAREITIELADGTRIRVDAIAVDRHGNIHIQEYKSSTTAGFTPNQRHAYDVKTREMRISGKIVGQKGLDAFGPLEIPKGFVIEIIRPPA